MTECDLVCEDLEGFVLFQNLHMEGVHLDQFRKIVSTATS
jgi:hypothetical protein